MPNLCDHIEEYLKEALRQAGEIVVQRSELAERFRCVPSQISYVLATRFTPAAGYLVESRRGGGGYIRIVRLQFRGPSALQRWLMEHVGEQMTQDEAGTVIRRLQEEQVITEREAAVMQAVVNRETLGVGLPERDRLRARLMQAMLSTILRFGVEGLP